MKKIGVEITACSIVMVIVWFLWFCLVKIPKADAFDDMMKRAEQINSPPLKWGDLLCVDSNLFLVRVTPESVHENMNRLAEIGGSIIGDPKNRDATILHVGTGRTNYHFTTNFTGTIQVGTNFWRIEKQGSHPGFVRWK